MRRPLCLLLSCVAAIPAAAQDVLGPVNPIGNPVAIAVDNAAEIQARDVARRRRGSNGSAERRAAPTPRQAAGCARKAHFRARLGPANAKVRQLYALCRRVGL